MENTVIEIVSGERKPSPKFEECLLKFEPVVKKTPEELAEEVQNGLKAFIGKFRK